MKDEEAIRLVKKVFEKIQDSNSIQDLEEIFKDCNFPKKNIQSIDLYPRIKFSITKEEIENLIRDKKISTDFNFTSILFDELGIADTFTKLLYSIIWKNGDLLKIKHIIKGIKSNSESETDKNDGLVFYHFGKYLSDKSEQPIIDQHVIRAFGIYKYEIEIDSLRKLKELKKQNKELSFHEI